MKFVIFIVIFVSIVNAEISEDDIREEINEVLDHASDISAEDKIYEIIDDHSARFFDEKVPDFDYVSDASDEEGIFEGIDGVRDRPVNEEGMENIANASISKDYVHKQAIEDFGDPCCYNVDEDEMSDDCYDDSNIRTKVNTKYFSIISDTKCLKDSYIVDSGYYDDYGSKKLVFKTCHNNNTGKNHYVRYIITPAHKRSRSTYKYWRTTNFPVEGIKYLYTINRQYWTIKEILGSAEPWINKNRAYGHYLGHGHLAAKCDFDEKLQQDSTFTYFNAAPQFQIFNNGNWRTVEHFTRMLAEVTKQNLVIYSGTFGVGKLKDIYDKPQPIFLGWPDKIISMPKLFYKIVIDEKLKKGIVLIGVNNPHLKKIPADYIICNDKDIDKKGEEFEIADRITWLKSAEPWNKKRRDTKRGYIYACTVENFIRKVPIFTLNYSIDLLL